MLSVSEHQQNALPSAISPFLPVNDKVAQMGSCNPGAEFVSVSTWPNEEYNIFKQEERKDGGSWGSEDVCGVKTEARGGGGLVSDAKTYVDMMGGESRAACEHIWSLARLCQIKESVWLLDRQLIRRKRCVRMTVLSVSLLSFLEACWACFLFSQWCPDSYASSSTPPHLGVTDLTWTDSLHGHLKTEQVSGPSIEWNQFKSNLRWQCKTQF